jgi:hypothetical protein
VEAKAPMAIVIVRVYLVGYIFCIIDCYICQDIFGMIDIMTTICI